MKQTPVTPEKSVWESAVWIRLKRLWRRIENIAFVLVMLLTFLYFVLQASWVQNWLIAKIANYLSSELQTNVSIQHIDVSFFDNLVLEGFYVEDLNGDTLLYAGSLTAGLNSNIFSLLRNRIEFNEINLQEARFNLNRQKGEAFTNLQFLVDYFGSPEPKTASKPKPFRISVQNLRLSDVQFLFWDAVRGQKMWGAIPIGLIRINQMDIASKILDVQSINLEGAVFTIGEFPASGTPVDAKQVAVQKPKPEVSSDTSIFRAKVWQLILKNCKFAMDRFDKSPGAQTPAGVMDYDHLSVSDIHLQADSVLADANLCFTGVLRHLSAREQGGLVLNSLRANEVLVSDTMVALYGMRLETNGSRIGDTLLMRYSTYRAFNDFNNKVRLEGHFDTSSVVRLGDIMFFSPEVANNSFFKKNQDQLVHLSGRVEGRINRLNGRDLLIRFGFGSLVKGSFDGDDLAEGSDRMRLLLDLEQVQSNIQTLRKVIPGFDPPAYFDKLGQFSFNGTYQLFFGTNHIFNGDLVSNNGFGKVDMKLDLTGGREKARYSGYLNMNEFDLKNWTGNPEFGKTTFRLNIASGTGLTLQTIKSDLTGTIDSFYFRGYNYQNVRLNGQFNRQQFKGDVAMEDPNIDFVFNGAVNLADSVPEYDFSADLRRLDMGALNLVDQDLILSGRIEEIKLVASDWSSLRGGINLRNFKIIQDKEVIHQIDSLTFAAFQLPSGERHFILLSDIADGYLKGQFEIGQIGKNLLRLLNRSFPDLVRQAYGTPVIDTTALTDNFKVNLQIKDTRSLTLLFDARLDTLRDFNLRASVNGADGSSDLSVQMPFLRFNGLTFHHVDFTWSGRDKIGHFELKVPKALLENEQELVQLQINGTAIKDQVNFSFSTEDTTSIIERIQLEGVLSIVDSSWQLHFNTSEITLFGDQWYMEENNFLRFSKNRFETSNFELMNGLQRINIEHINAGSGVRFSLSNFNLNFINRFAQIDNISYSAKIFNLDIEIQDVFQLKDIQGYITTDTVFINEQPFGFMIGNIEMPDLNSPLWWKIFLSEKDKHQLRVLGAFVPRSQEKAQLPELGVIRPGEFQTHVTALNFPLGVLELFIPEISKTFGRINSDVRLGGPINKIGMRGSARVDGGFQLDYLKAMFHIPNQVINLSEYQIWADGDTILDGSQKSHAVIQGGLRHDHFRSWQLDCSIRSIGDNFMIMNTLKGDNSLYYGQGIGRFDAKFTGSFSKTNISIDAEAGKETRLFIPLGSEELDIEEASFITFKNTGGGGRDNQQGKTQFVLSDLKGLNFEMNLSITEDAEVQLIFDEQAGDLIKGRGEGDIRLTINREGDFKMYGSYRIRKGEYLFTLLNWVNKPFTVLDGGLIEWYGDPYGAQISLDATYTENTSLYNLLRDELLATNNLSGEASKSTRVVVTMHLIGDLFKPNISFDLNFPNLSSQLKSLVDSKLSLLRQDQNELTRQVFGLIVVGSFLPPAGAGANIQSSDYLASAFNTLTQVLSNQFSNYLTTLAAEWFGGAVSSIDFDIAYNEYRNQTDPSQNLAQIGRELQVRLTSGFAKDRITVQVGSQFGIGQPGTTTAEGFLGEDVTVEIQLTENRQWRLKVYQRTEPDIAGGARRSRYGFGISFRKEYESFGDLIDGLTGWMKSKKK